MGTKPESEVREELGMSEEHTPDGVCFPCGRTFLTEEQLKEEGHAVTAWGGLCTVCGEMKAITDSRHFNYLKKPKDGNESQSKDTVDTTPT